MKKAKPVCPDCGGEPKKNTSKYIGRFLRRHPGKCKPRVIEEAPK